MHYHSWWHSTNIPEPLNETVCNFQFFYFVELKGIFWMSGIYEYDLGKLSRYTITARPEWHEQTWVMTGKRELSRQILAILWDSLHVLCHPCEAGSRARWPYPIASCVPPTKQDLHIACRWRLYATCRWHRNFIVCNIQISESRCRKWSYRRRKCYKRFAKTHHDFFHQNFHKSL